jgi:transposase
LQPHRCEYYERPNIRDWQDFTGRVDKLCQLNGSAQQLLEQDNTLVLSTDEKSGIQALERAAPDLAMNAQQLRKREVNYIRHGTQTLIGALDLSCGRVYAKIGDTRTEQDYATFIAYLAEREPHRKLVITADQLNTHKSETLVRLVAQLNGDLASLGCKGKRGVLKSMASRMEYLEREKAGQRIRFVFIPKHCSWLNLIEGWFSSLSKRVLQMGSFVSTQDLANKILNYLDYFNQYLARTINWSKSNKEQIDKLVTQAKYYIMQLTG